MARRDLLRGTATPTAQAPKAEPIAAPQSTLSPEQVTFLEAPEVYASAVQVSLVSNDFNITLLRPRMAHAVIDGQTVQASTLLPTVYVSLSAATAKDFLLSLQEVVEAYEKDFGPIETAYSRAQHQKKK